MAAAEEPRFSGSQQPLSPRKKTAMSPGPGQYNPDTPGEGAGFRSVHSKRGNAPKFSFGSAKRSQYTRTYISKQHNMILGTDDTQNVDYLPVDKTSSFATQPSSQRPTSPRASFGSSPRDISPKQHFDNMRSAEGRVLHTTKDVDFLPGLQTTSIGSQVPSSRRSAPSHGFGSAPRDAVHKLGVDKKLTASLVRTTTANVDAYVSRSAFAGQSESKRPSSPRAVFGSSTRGGLSSSVVTKGGLLMNSKNLEGLNKDVGYMGEGSLHQNSTGRQISSSRRSQPAFSFGSAPRTQYERSFLSKAHNAKMPQISTSNTDYGETEQVNGKQTSSKRRTAPSYGFGTARRDSSFMSMSPRRGPTALWPTK